jgi:hypothetical protein
MSPDKNGASPQNRREAMPRLAVATISVALCCAAGHAQGCGADLAGAKTLEAANQTLMFRTEPTKIVVGRHFAIDVVVCPKAGVAPPEQVIVDAHMPEHRHGMNYKPSIKALGGGRFRADGMMFHMPGRWEFRFEIEGKGGREQLTSSMVLR